MRSKALQSWAANLQLADRCELKQDGNPRSYLIKSSFDGDDDDAGDDGDNDADESHNDGSIGQGKGSHHVRKTVKKVDNVRFGRPPPLNG